MHWLGFQPNGSELADQINISAGSSESLAILLNTSTDNRIRVGGTDLNMGTVGGVGVNSWTGSVTFGATWAGYCNGVLAATNGSAPAAPSYTGTRVGLGFFPPNINTSNTAITLLGTFHNRALSAGEVAWIDAEPFVMLRPVVRRQYYTTVAGAPAVNLGWLQQPSQPLITRPEMIPY